MDRTNHHPFSTISYFAPGTLTDRPIRAYDSIRRHLFGASPTGILSEPIDGQLIHNGLILGGDGIPELWMPGDTLVAINAWISPQAADQAFNNQVKPAITAAGYPGPEEVTGLELIGCLGNPDISDFGNTAYASIMVWPDLREDATELYTAIFDQVIGHGQPFPEGSGTHFAFRLGNQVITWDIARSEADHGRALQDRIMPEVTAVFTKFGVSGQPAIVSARACGLSVSEEVRYCKSA